MPPRLRTSCDACQTAKIKCLKTTTGCQHCDKSAGEVACIHSPVLPRISYKKNNHRNGVNCSQSWQSNLTSNPSLLRELEDDDCATQTVLSQISHPTTATPASTFDSQLYPSSFDAALSPCSWQQISESSLELSHSPTAPYTWSSIVDGSESSTGTPALTNAATPATVASLSSIPAATKQSQASNTSNFTHYASSLHRVPAAEDSTALLTETTASSPSPPACDCFAHLLKAMQRTNAHITAINPSLDSVLCANRIAAKDCFASLRCSYQFIPISHKSVSSCATIAYGLLDRIIASYLAALETFSLNLNEEGENALPDDDDPQMDAQATTVQFRLGSFALEKSEQVIWAKTIVKKEVEKIQETLKRLETDSYGIHSLLLARSLKGCEMLVNEVSHS